MAFYIKISLIIIGLIGWSLFFYIVYQSAVGRKKEIELIQDISNELKQVKSEIEKLK